MKKKHFNFHLLGYKSQQQKINTFRKWDKQHRRNDRRVNFVCHDCGLGFKAFARCKIQKVYCGKCGALMARFKGFFCDIRPDLKKCDYCGCCDTGTDADFDRYAVEVQNGDGYYNEFGDYISYNKYQD